MNPARGIALKLGSVLLFTLMAACVKAAREVAPAGEAVFFRSFFAIPPILAYALWRGRLSEAWRVKDRFAHLNRGLVGVAAMGCGFTALGFLPLPEVIAIGYAAPLIATALAALMLGETVRAFRWSAVALGLGGVLIMLWPKLTILLSGDFSDGRAIGAWLAFLAACMTALATTHIRRLTRTETTLSIVFWFTISCTLAALTTLPFGWVWPATPMLGVMVLSGLFGGIAQIMMTASYRQADASLLAPFDYSSMIYGLALGYALFGDMPDAQLLVGAGVVIAAGLAIIWRERALAIDRRASKRAGERGGT